MQVSKTVFILGAGASKSAGVPVMADFLDEAELLLNARGVPDQAEHFERVLDAINMLSRVHSKAKVDVRNMESVFTAFEMALTIGRFGDYDEQQIEALARSMRVLITATVERTLRFPHGERGMSPPHDYKRFVALLHFLMDSVRPKHTVSVITFNYDIALDFAFHNAVMPITYALPGESGAAGTPLLKLHGSINWARCERCGAVEAWSMADYLGAHGYRKLPDLHEVRVLVGSKISEYPHACHGYDADSDDAVSEPRLIATEPVIVPPTWNKGDYHRELATVWNRAAYELSDAENIIVIGYSLPSSDQFFRYLYALGTIGSRPLKRFWVFNPDATVKESFDNILGVGVEGRFKFFDHRFDKAHDELKKAFQ